MYAYYYKYIFLVLTDVRITGENDSKIILYPKFK